MYEEENITPSEKALESALSQLKPVTNTLNRDQLMFKAGRASVSGKLPWQLVSGTLTVLLLCSLLFNERLNEVHNIPHESNPNHYPVAQIDYQPVYANSSDSVAYPVLRNNILKYGLDILQSQPGTGHSESIKNRNELMEAMMSL